MPISTTGTPVLDRFPSESTDAAHIVIIGAGITGLSAAYYTQIAAATAGVPVRYTLLERDDVVGGKIQTEHLDSPDAFVIEGGPDSFVTQKPWAMDLVQSLGIGDQVMCTNKAKHTTLVLSKGRLQPLPEGLQMIVPTKFMPFALSPLISPLGKLRMAMDVFIPARRDNGDESLATFILRRLGREALNKIGDPLMAGIHSSDASKQSIMATFPRFRALEAKHGSLIKGMLAARRQLARQPASRFATAPFVTLRNGMRTLVGALVPRLTGTVRTNTVVERLERGPDGDGYSVHLGSGEAIHADAVILASPAYVAADLIDEPLPDLAAQLRTIRYVSTAIVSLVYRRSEIGDPLPAFGVVIPKSEGRKINACTVSSNKFANRAPDDYTLVRVFVGGAQHPELLSLDDVTMEALARSELRDLLGITAEPVLRRVARWNRANPQYDVGHLARVDALEAMCPPDLVLAGSAYRGVGIPDCIHQGKEAAEKVVALLSNKQPQLS